MLYSSRVYMCVTKSVTKGNFPQMFTVYIVPYSPCTHIMFYIPRICFAPFKVRILSSIGYLKYLGHVHPVYGVRD